MLPELIIFDCDGVLVDSEVISCRDHADLLRAAGATVTFDDFRQLPDLVRQIGAAAEAN